jgi:Ca2+-binding EF-hand superfamily protein
MKNIVTVIALYFTFSAFVYAQKVKQEDPKVLAKKELTSLLKFIDIDNSIVININDLLIYKHETFNKYPERKEETAATIEAKLKGTLTADEFLKIKNNKTLFNDLLY